ncbi:MAG: DUF2007 domain-containing protein [Dehalococcoidales bacterium]
MNKSAVNKDKEMVEVYRAAGEMEAQIIKGLLESHGISCLLKSNAAPSVHVFVVDGMGEVQIMVWKEVAGKARGVIEGKGNV